MDLGCGDRNCYFRRNTGQGTNGGCRCVRRHATHTGDGWTIPVHVVQMMVARAAQVASSDASYTIHETMANAVIDAAKTAQRLFGLSDKHVLMCAIRDLEAECDRQDNAADHLPGKTSKEE